MDPIQKNARNPKHGIIQCLLTQSAAATPSCILPPRPQVWIRAAQPSGVRWERHSTASQSIDTGQAAASIHRMHHPNERRVGGSKIGHAEEPVSAACAVLSPCYLPPSDTFSRHKLSTPGRRRDHSAPLDHPERKNEEKRPITARACHMAPVDIVEKQTGLLRNLAIGR
jgi:hypothetical protein